MTERTARNSPKTLAKLLRFIGAGGAAATIGPNGVGLENRSARMAVPVALIDQALAAGLIAACFDPANPAVAGWPAGEGERRGLTLLPAARSFLRRAAAEAEEAFLAQHTDVVTAVAEVDGVRQAVRLDQSESPLAALSRLKDRNGLAFLPPAALAAGEKLAADFTRGQLQPRVTASWEPKLSSRTRGGRGGMADIADSAMAARLAVNRAAAAMGPELSGVALDICCFMKGLTTVERERQWPARSAKLMLRTALLALSRHYAPPPPEKPGVTRHWGAEGYRPDWL